MNSLEERRERLLSKLKLKLRLNQNKIYFCLGALWFAFLAQYIYLSVHIEKPTKSHPIVSYYEESGDDLKYIYCSILQRAQKSITYSSFGMSDPDIIRILKEKKAQGLEVTNLNSKQEKSRRRKIHGLYHRKLLMIDGKELYVGSANCTQSSLCFHGNQIVGFYNPELITSIKENKSYINDNLQFYLLPDLAGQALDEIITKIQNAKDRIILTSYRLTHPLIIDELIAAHSRGIDVQVYVDSGCLKGTCKKVTGKLLKSDVPIHLRIKSGLLHHKSIVIDNSYIFGSTNFSRAGFKRNEETLVIIPQTPKALQDKIDSFLKMTKRYTRAA